MFVKFTSKSKSGTGLGLFISKAFVDARGGKIQAYNNVTVKVLQLVTYIDIKSMLR